MTSLPRRIASNLALPVGFLGYMFILHYGWHKLQDYPLAKGGRPAPAVTSDRIKKAFFGDGQKEAKESDK